jgi:hypothetical protein
MVVVSSGARSNRQRNTSLYRALAFESVQLI